MKRINIKTVLLVCVVMVGGCEFSGPSRVSMGMAKIYLKPGKTTKLEVFEIFGPPNHATIADGQTTLIYDKVSSRESSSFLGLGGGGGGLGSGGAGGGVIAAGFGSSTRSETTVMLIIYLDDNDLVRDYRFSQSKF